jgi:hypothetical protein
MSNGFTEGGEKSKDAVQMNPALQLPITATQPYECSTAKTGTILLDSKANICLCDGKAWALGNTKGACSWNTSAK